MIRKQSEAELGKTDRALTAAGQGEVAVVAAVSEEGQKDSRGRVGSRCCWMPSDAQQPLAHLV